MSFLYPLFLAAGLSLGIPVLIHLFNLRKYKTVMFPHIRFLKDIQLTSRKQSQLKYKWLLAMRMLFLAFLVLAFAQPFFNNTAKTVKGNRLQMIYIDNSWSMSVKKGARTMLDLAKENAISQLKYAAPGTRFLLLTNDKPISFHAEPTEKVMGEINQLDFTSASKTFNQVALTAQSMLQNESISGGDVFYYSDFQITAINANPDSQLTKNLVFYCLPMQSPETEDVYIDTAFLTIPVLQAGKNNYLVVHTHLSGKEAKEGVVLQLTVNGQVKSAATLNFTDRKESIDTLSFQVNDANWQKIQLSVNDATVRFDDTFRISARSSANLAILVLNEGQSNPYIQAAFRAYNGFRLNNLDIHSGLKDWNNYNLVILNGITNIDESTGRLIDNALQSGQSVCIFPGKTYNFSALNDGLKLAGDIHFNALDTATQTAATLQQGSALVKDLFEKIPENVQLPVTNWHYSISAGLSANQQSVLSFRSGDPMLARYTPSRGQLYIYAASADLQSGNFPGSYFFAPFLYQMAIQSSSSNIYAVTAGSTQSVYFPLANATERNTLHLYGHGTDVIPAQHPNAAGLDVAVGSAVQQPGFYELAAPQSDTALVALNPDKQESHLDYANIADLKRTWKNDNIQWPDMTHNGSFKDAGAFQFPLWKACVILALLVLAAETFLLVRKPAAIAAAA